MTTTDNTVCVTYSTMGDEHKAHELGRRLKLSGYNVDVSYDTTRRGIFTSLPDNIDRWLNTTEIAAFLDTKEKTTGVNIEFCWLENGLGLELPAYETAGAAGMDLRAAFTEQHPNKVLYGGDRMLVPCGFSLALPVGYEAQVRPRSGLALKKGITVLNSPGTVDSDYRGQVGVILINHSQEPFPIARGDRIAQLVIAPVAQARFQVVKTLSETTRGAGGFGSTGL